MHSEARLYINTAVIALLVGALLFVCIFAWLKGRRAEQLGATIYFVSALVTYAFDFMTGGPPPIVVELAFDTLVAIGFLMLAISYNNLWLGAAMIIKGMQLAVHATHLTDIDDPYLAGFNLYAASLNLISLLILLTILGGTLASIRSRRSAISRPSAAITDEAVQQDSA